MIVPSGSAGKGAKQLSLARFYTVPLKGQELFSKKGVMDEKELYIIYVDDDADDRMIFSEAFDKHQTYRLVTLESGASLFRLLGEKAGTTPPCLIIIDINIPLQSGIEIMQALKNNTRYERIPVVMFSTSATPTERVQCEQYGVDILVKPSSFQELQESQKILLRYCDPLADQRG
jgi:CheY-like chemotaxis protein